MDTIATQWAFGLCATGFFVLLGFIVPISNQTAKIPDLQKKMDKIENKLMGDMDKAGLITIVHDQGVKIDKIDAVCKERHEK